MRLADIAKLGEIFEIKLEHGCTRTKLLHVFEDGEFSVFQPVFRGLPIRADDDETFSFTFCRPEGVYIFDAAIMGTYLKDGLRLCRFRQATGVRRKQRRLAYRLPVVRDAMLEWEDDRDPGGQTAKAKTRNMSEKSVQLTCYKPLSEKQSVTVKIYLDKPSSVELRAEVLKCNRPEKSSDPYEIVLLFTDYTQSDIACIRRFILQQQINAKKLNDSDKSRGDK